MAYHRVIKLFYVNLAFPWQLSGNPQAHFLHQEVCKYNFENFKLNSIQINQPSRCNSFTSLLLDVYVQLNLFRAPLRPSSGAYNYTRSLWFYRWSVAGRGLPDHDQQRSNRHAPTVKPEAANAVVSSW